MNRITNTPTFETNPEENSDDLFEQECYKIALKGMIDKCPPLIKEITQSFTSPTEQTMALFGAITLSGGLMPGIFVNYADKYHYPMLMLLIVFPPASGKGGLKMVRKLGYKINNELMEKNSQAMIDFKKAEHFFKTSKQSDSLPLPEKPKQPIFLAPGNITSARLNEHLIQNGPDQSLLIFETETDAFGMSAANRQYGSMLSVILRQAYEFEPISQSRKTNSELSVIEIPKLGIVLSGTESQIFNIFKSNEDGLFSRFMVICGKASPQWIDVKPDPAKPSLDIQFEDLAERFYLLWEYFKDKKIEVKFSDMQWVEINEFGKKNLAITYHFSGEVASSIAKRHSNMITRIAAVLTMLRYYDRNGTESIVYCTADDFAVAYWMVENSLNWSMELYKKLPSKRTSETTSKKWALLKGLAEEFELKDIQNTLPTIKIPYRTLTRWLTQFVQSGFLERAGHGCYKKTDMAQLALAQLSENEDE